jgi:hypothetical protein
MNANIVNIHTHAGTHRHLSRSAIEAMRAANWGFTAVAAAAAKYWSWPSTASSSVLLLFAQQAVGGLVYHPCHVVFAPVVSVLAHFFLALFTILWWLSLPGFIFLLFLLVVSILLVLLLDPLVALFLFFICNSVEFGVQLELAFEHVKGSGHCNNLLII